MADFVVIENHAEQIKSDIEKALMRAAEIIGGKCEKYAKQNLRRNGSIQTSRLFNSITHDTKKEGGDIVATIGTNVEYSPYVELGHHQEPGRYVPALGKRLVADWVAPKPYLRPALEDHILEYQKIINQEMRNG